MNKTHITSFLGGAAVATLALFAVGASPRQEGGGKPSPEEMQKMMENASQYTTPGPHHELLERFIGRWETSIRFTMPGMNAPPEPGTCTFDWLIAGRWLKGESGGTMMGMPMQGFLIMGYDNLKMSYVTCQVSSMDTAMLTSEGDLDPNGKALITYGTLDEYLTGEHDKMVRYVWRFVSDDEMRLEVDDLSIGEHHNQVLEMTYRRKK